MGFFDFFTSILTGGATGLLGMILSAVVKHAEARQRLQEKRLDFAHELELQRLAMQTRGQELESEQAIAEIASAESMRVASYRHDESYGQPSQWATNVLRLFRPVITMVLIGLSALLFFSLYNDEQRQQIVEMVTYATTTAMVWWFGARDLEKRR
jgi:hypothetical protein